MQHLVTASPAHVRVEYRPSPFLGFLAVAVDADAGVSVEAWGRTQEEAGVRAEYLLPFVATACSVAQRARVAEAACPMS